MVVVRAGRGAHRRRPARAGDAIARAGSNGAIESGPAQASPPDTSFGRIDAARFVDRVSGRSHVPQLRQDAIGAEGHQLKGRTVIFARRRSGPRQETDGATTEAEQRVREQARRKMADAAGPSRRPTSTVI